MPRGNGNINIFKFQNTKNQQTKKCSWNTKQTRKQKLISISFTLGNDSFFVRREHVVLCELWLRYKNAYTQKIAYSLPCCNAFFSQVCVFVFFFLIPWRLYMYIVIFFSSLFYDLTKIHAYFYESLLLCIALQKVFLWYAVIRERRTREAKAQNREKCCLLLFGPLLHSLRQYRWEMRCNQFVCKCHRKMQQQHKWIHVCFYWRLRHLFAVGFLDKK